MTSAKPRVAVIGASTRRQGLGPYIIRYLHEHGAKVCAVLATSRKTAEEAADAVGRLQYRPAAFLDLEPLIQATRPDGVVIASPAHTHAAYLHRCIATAIPCLCEKPLVWGGEDDAATALAVGRMMDQQGAALLENCIWPYTLPAFAELHPGALDAPPKTLEMWLSPRAGGAQDMIREAMSHPISLAQALLTGPRESVEDVRFSTHDPDTERLEIRFRYRRMQSVLDVHVQLEARAEQPRPAGYAIDGRRAERRVRMEDYALFFEDDGCSVRVPDPLGALVGDFVRVLTGSRPEGDPWFPAERGIIDRMEHLVAIREAFATGAADD